MTDRDKDGSLQGRVALVTGASQGIGAAIAHQLASDGAELLLVARNAEKLRNLADELAGDGVVARTYSADLARDEEIDALVTAIRGDVDRLDILINNAGVLPPAKRTERTTRAEWNAVLDLNLSAPWFLACRAKEMMPAGGVVINMSSTAAGYPSIGLVPYNVSKAAVTMLTESLALEWARDHVRVLGVAPGKVNTAMVVPILEWAEKKKLQVNPLGRVGEPSEIAGLVSFLCSDAAAYMTGTTVPIDGGELLTSGR